MARAVLTLDRWLRQQQGIFEYTSHAECLFRLEQGRADQTLRLADGTCIRRGEPILKLHIWNEQVPRMGRQGPTVGWARRLRRAMEISLHEMARWLKTRADLRDIAAICADMQLGTAVENRQLARIVMRYGFETQDVPDAGRSNRLHHIGERILMCMLVLATNPAALRAGTLRRDYMRIYLSRAVLERRYGGR